MQITIQLTQDEQTSLDSLVAAIAPSDTVASYLARVVEKFIRGTVLSVVVRAEREKEASMLIDAFRAADNTTKDEVVAALGITRKNLPVPID